MSRALELLRDQRVLITGASGFLGTRQMRALRGHAELFAVSRSRLEPGPGVQTLQADLSQRDLVLELFRQVRPDCVIHLAGYANGQREIENLHPSVMGDLLATVNVLEAAHYVGCARLVTTASLEEPHDDALATSPYGVSKAAAGCYTELCHRLYGLPVVSVRIFMAYGPGQRSTKFVPQLVASLATGQPFEMRSADREVDWIYADDVTEAITRAAALPRLEGLTFDVGSGETVQLGAVARMAARILGREDLLRTVQRGGGKERERAADLDVAVRLLDWRPQVGLDEGLRRTIEAFQAKGASV
ncbi:MAG: NAD(P)-dependent oxidoreductase [Acidobacteria bacterium]|nr:NAD(P)-dependent oxidoreductase [Acidobacteriota bacterium]